MEELYREFEQLASKNEPLQCAGIMMAQALKIYKAALSEDEFKMITSKILESRDDIQMPDKPTLN
jgi:flagellar motor switch protein FliG